MNRYAKALFVGSLALNFLLAGIVIGHTLHGWRRGHHASPAQEALSPEQRAQVQERLAHILSEGDAGRKQGREIRDGLFAILTAPSFDEAAYRAQVEAMQAQREQGSEALSRAVVEAVRDLSQPERAALVEMMRRSFRERRERESH